ncbi:MAG: SDR family oxidoreductase [Actinomycetota bacterium]|nr:SDR family oxidoreductase [Actinomycetota bacterium]
MSLILVTGGTGVLGRAVVRHLLDSGHQVRVASRRPPPAGPRPYAWTTVDYRSGEGLDTALHAADSVIHCAGDFRGEVDRAVLTALRAAGGPHLVYISIVGVDRIPLAYYRLKLAAEQAIETSNVPYTILRTTQFHDLIRCMLAATARLPVMLVPDLSVQPIAVRDVAVRLVELAARRPSGHARDLGGPEVQSFRRLAEAYLRATGRRRLLLPVRFPGKVFRGYRHGEHLAPHHAEGRITFDMYLATQSAPARISYRGSR